MNDISKFIVFIPKHFTTLHPLYFYGDVELNENNIIFYVTSCSLKLSESLHLIGTCSDRVLDLPSTRNNYFIQLSPVGNAFTICSFETNSVKCKVPTDSLIVVYDKLAFEAQCNNLDKISYNRNDHFQTLLNKLQSRKTNSYHSNSIFVVSTVKYFVACILNFMLFVEPIAKYSFIYVQCKELFSRLFWACTSVKTERKISVKVFNFLLSLVIDLVLGFVFLSILSLMTSLEDFPVQYLKAAESVVDSLRDLLKWLAGSPAGFKLNSAFNSMLEKFFLFHIDVWWFFLVSISPGLGVVFRVFTVLGQLGLTVQAAILSDLLAFVSFHAYCIYAYAARLYNLQLSGLLSLWRLFLGRKWNPLREKVDSCQYTADQLFVGTLLFTILLFLLPTTLLYYVVFTSFRLVIVGFGGLLTRLRIYCHGIPIYSLLLWFLRSYEVSSQVRLHPRMDNQDVVVVEATLVANGLISTLREGVPDCLDIPPIFKEGFRGFAKQLATGQILYPI